MLLLSFGGNWWLAAMSHPQGFSVLGGEYKIFSKENLLGWLFVNESYKSYLIKTVWSTCCSGVMPA